MILIAAADTKDFLASNKKLPKQQLTKSNTHSLISGTVFFTCNSIRLNEIKLGFIRLKIMRCFSELYGAKYKTSVFVWHTDLFVDSLSFALESF